VDSSGVTAPRTVKAHSPRPFKFLRRRICPTSGGTTGYASATIVEMEGSEQTGAGEDMLAQIKEM
jgi:hypothetical protein